MWVDLRRYWLRGCLVPVIRVLSASPHRRWMPRWFERFAPSTFMTNVQQWLDMAPSNSSQTTTGFAVACSGCASRQEVCAGRQQGGAGDSGSLPQTPLLLLSCVQPVTTNKVLLRTVLSF
ncbi:ubiquinol-cytochrome c reductase core protein 1, isoform CRA_b, partial [Rattus norvegicus]